ELLKNDMVKPDDRVPFAGKIYDEAQRMIRLVEDIISLSHLDEGAGDMPRENTDLYELAGKAVWSLEAQAGAAHVALELAGMSAVLYGIPQLLYSIVYNLCDNAIKYNRENGKVMVNVEKQEKGIILTVRDTGIGIAAEDRERIFERFYRVDKSHSREVGGTGLGLSIVKHAVIIHHAEMEVDSTPGKGAAITVTFPETAEKL
ncbi:MAG TPA: PAS domain-containing sensor histidine kinase, partial [Lachnospiraceae bacterium]|nr:PAS domain-containing sensor histidine kinase [Lachnospiraceae bacterium]